jgi:tRNA threonylcarbamoyladenosine biosynthesis protein TsaE
VDLYRLDDASQAADIGLEDILYSDCISIVEWAERLGNMLPSAAIKVTIEPDGAPDDRLISITADAPEIKARLGALATSLVRFGGR